MCVSGHITPPALVNDFTPRQGKRQREKGREREKRHQKGNDSDSKLMKGSSSVSLVFHETESQYEDYTLQHLFFLGKVLNALYCAVNTKPLTMRSIAVVYNWIWVRKKNNVSNIHYTHWNIWQWINELGVQNGFKRIFNSIHWFVIAIRQKILRSWQNYRILHITNPLTIIYLHKTEELHAPTLFNLMANVTCDDYCHYKTLMFN